MKNLPLTKNAPRLRKSTARETEVRLVKASDVKTRKPKTDSETPAPAPAT